MDYDIPSASLQRIRQYLPTTIITPVGGTGSGGLDAFSPELDTSFTVRPSDTGWWEVRMRNREFAGTPAYSRVLSFNSLERCLDFIYDALVVLETLEDHNGE